MLSTGSRDNVQSERTNCRQDKQISRRGRDKKTVVGVGATRTVMMVGLMQFYLLV